MSGSNFVNIVNKVERIVTGVTHPYLGAIPTKGTIPIAETLTGTISTDNAGTSAGVIGVGTGSLFLTELSAGDFLYDSDAAIRKILYVFSDTMIQFEEKFPASLSSVAVKRPKNQYYKQVLAESTGSTNAKLQESVFKAASKTVLDGSPVTYDVTTASSEITFDCSK